MEQIEDKSIDMVLCDLPYGTTACSWDIIIPFEKLWSCYERIIKNKGVIVLTASQPFTSLLISSNLSLFKQHLIWLKTRPTNVFNAKKMFTKWHEDICVFYKELPTFNPQMRDDGIFTGKKVQRMNTNRLNGTLGKTGERKDYVHEGNNGLFYPKTILQFSNVNIPSLHPTQKPVDLFEYLIRTYTNKKDLVLDNCIGSGTTAIACKKLNRDFIGIEISKEYCEIAKRRLGNTESDLLSQVTETKEVMSRFLGVM